uniref:DUF148 domain-containing protein n=1 Tax=Caenorhabditis tropicalis TaxID=1561998 RepID=A0A1I7UY07_9PELO
MFELFRNPRKMHSVDSAFLLPNSKFLFLVFPFIVFHLQNFVPQPLAATFENFSNNMKNAGLSRKSYQALQSYQLRYMKRFHSESYESFLNQRKKFDEARRKMDQAKADVRDAKTTTAIEKKAICYQLTVDDFDQQTEELIKIIEALPKLKQGYIRDIILVLAKHKSYHIDMSKFFAASCA